MNTRDATALIAAAVPRESGAWADFGAGSGTFARALAARLDHGSRIYAVDRDPEALSVLERWAAREHRVIPVRADLEQRFDLPGLERGQLDGMLVANTLHFFADPPAVLARLAAWLRPGGRAVIVEYDHRAANRWVPYPIAAADLPSAAVVAGLSPPEITARRRSAFGGILYVAKCERLPEDRRHPT